MRTLNKMLAVLVMALGLISSAWAVTPERTLIELFWADQDRYVVVYQEEAPIALNRPGSPWKTTGRTFVVNATQLAGQVPVARLYNPGVGSHVMLLPGELQVVLQRWASDWILESRDFFWADQPANGACATGVPLYRLYNDGRNGAPNHRFTTDLAEAQEIAKTWGTLEGLVMCIGGAGTVPGTSLHSAGTILIEDSSHSIQFNLDTGKYYGLADKDGSYDVDPSNIEKVCFNSNRRGWTDKSVSCAPVDANHRVTLPKSCNNDQGTWSVKLRDGRWLWFDLTSDEAFSRKGFSSTLLPNGLVSYGVTGYQSSQVTVAAGGKLRIDFGSNCLTGFGKPLEVEDLLFVWNSDKSGAGGQSGWGLNSITGSIKQGYLDWNPEKNAFFVEFTGLACSDHGNITVYKKLSGTGTAVVWDAGSDGFGYAWFAIPPKGEVNPVWQVGPGVTWDQDKWLVNYSIPGC